MNETITKDTISIDLSNSLRECFDNWIEFAKVIDDKELEKEYKELKKKLIK